MNFTLANWKSSERNTRKGYIDCTFNDIGLTVRGLAVHHFTDKGRWWLAMPARDYKDNATGETKWWAHVVFDKEGNNLFQEEAVAQLARMLPGVVSAPAPQPAQGAYRSDQPSRRQSDMALAAQAPATRMKAAPAASGPDLDDEIPF